MKFQRLLILVFAAALTAGTCAANSVVTLLLSADDYGVVKIDNNLAISYSGSSASDPLTTFATLNLVDGWHDISIDYKNTTGAYGLTLYETYSPVGSVDTSMIVSLQILRSLGPSGSMINGLQGEYFNLDGTPIQTWTYPGPVLGPVKTYGEGPLNYTSTTGPWAGLNLPSPFFEEKLTGQIYIGSNTNPIDPPPPVGGDAPEPAGWWLAAAALPLMLFSRLRLRHARTSH